MAKGHFASGHWSCGHWDAGHFTGIGVTIEPPFVPAEEPVAVTDGVDFRVQVAVAGVLSQPGVLVAGVVPVPVVSVAGVLSQPRVGGRAGGRRIG